MPADRSLPVASLSDTLRIAGQILAPTVAKGAIIRRKRMVSLVDRFDLDSRAVRRMQALRNTYGSGPLRLKVPFISRAVVLDHEHVREVLEKTPDPYATETDEKRGALSHFEPKNSLISHGADREARRAANEQALATERPVHPSADAFIRIVHEEAVQLLAHVDAHDGHLDWEPFFDTWFRVVRRVVFGDAARDDTELTDIVEQLRRDGNWSFFRPQRTELRDRFFTLLEDRVRAAEDGSLAAAFRDMPFEGQAAPLHQVPQWLFAFDPAGMATYRTLAMLATHPEAMSRAQKEIAADTSGSEELRYLQACVLDTLRLWPTAPMILRQTTNPTVIDGHDVPSRSEFLVYAPFFHRDDERLPFAHRFAPDVWLDEKNVNEWPLVPFSMGPGVCPGRNVVLLTTSAMLGALIEGRNISISSKHRLSPWRDLPGTMDHYGLRYTLGPQQGASADLER